MIFIAIVFILGVLFYCFAMGMTFRFMKEAEKKRRQESGHVPSAFDDDSDEWIAAILWPITIPIGLGIKLMDNIMYEDEE